MSRFKRELPEGQKVTDHTQSDVFLTAVIIATPLVYAIKRIWEIVFGETKPAFDFVTFWEPLSDAVLSGSPIYLNGTADNKPPVFLFVDLFTGLFDQQAAVFVLLVGLTNGIAAVLLWRLLEQYGGRETGIIAAILFLLLVPAFNAHLIQAGSFAMTFVLMSLLTDRAVVSGVLVAIAGLFYQYAVLVVPAVLLVQLCRTEKDTVRWGALYVGGGLLTVAVVFAIVGLLWSPKSALAGLYWSFGIPTGVTSAPLRSYTPPPGQYVGGIWLLNRPERWAGFGSQIIRNLLPLFIPIGIALKSETWTFDSESIVMHTLVLAFAASLPLLIRTYLDYTILALPFICVLAAIGIERLIRMA